jgi:transitional endoplasmic reticulum ATPase
VRWDDVGGLTETKDRLIEAVEWPLRYGKLFRQARVRPPRGILLAGPPGCGKTLLAKAAANETQANFISVKGPQLIDKFVGESERKVRDVFQKARQAAPCIIFFDEIDAIAPSRGGGGEDGNVSARVVAQLLTELDGVEEMNGVLVLAATNRIDMIDEALLRPGRFDEIIRIPRPSEDGRREIFAIHLDGRPLGEGITPDELAELTPQFSGSEIAEVCRLAAMSAIRQNVNLATTTKMDPGDLVIERVHFLSAIDTIQTDRKGVDG